MSLQSDLINLVENSKEVLTTAQQELVREALGNVFAAKASKKTSVEGEAIKLEEKTKADKIQKIDVADMQCFIDSLIGLLSKNKKVFKTFLVEMDKSEIKLDEEKKNIGMEYNSNFKILRKLDVSNDEHRNEIVEKSQMSCWYTLRWDKTQEGLDLIKAITMNIRDAYVDIIKK